MNDIVELLDALSAMTSKQNLSVVQRGWIKRARDEIVELRKERYGVIVRAGEQAEKVRTEALEEAARVCDAHPQHPDTRTSEHLAATIRALKDAP